MKVTSYPRALFIYMADKMWIKFAWSSVEASNILHGRWLYAFARPFNSCIFMLHVPNPILRYFRQFLEAVPVAKMAGSETPAQKALRTATADLARSLVPGNIYNDLFSMGYLSTPQLELVQGLVDQKKQSRANEEIVMAMLKRSDREIVAFCNLLYKRQLRVSGQVLLQGKPPCMIN